MQHSEIVAEPDPSCHFRSVNMGTINGRTRKCSMDHYSNKLLLDKNGNTPALCRLSSLSEDGNELELDEINANTAKPEITDDGTWKKALINQIQDLLKDVTISQSLTEKVFDEIMDKTMNNDVAMRNRRSSCFTFTSTTNPSRRNSATPKSIQNNVEHKGRRMSHAGMISSLPSTSGRRCSVAYLPSYGRRLSYANNNFLPNHVNFYKQRRKSSAKPVALNVVKVSSVQKQLHKIYKRRRRKERASVNIEDVRHALRSSNDKGNSDSDSDTEKCDNNNVAEDISDPGVWEDVGDVTDSIDIDVDSTFVEAENGDIDGTAPVSENGDIEGTAPVSENGDIEGTAPVSRRRDSTQMRAWELSRRLRQRRKGRRQVSADF